MATLAGALLDPHHGGRIFAAPESQVSNGKAEPLVHLGPPRAECTQHGPYPLALTTPRTTEHDDELARARVTAPAAACGVGGACLGPTPGRRCPPGGGVCRACGDGGMLHGVGVNRPGARCGLCLDFVKAGLRAWCRCLFCSLAPDTRQSAAKTMKLVPEHRPGVSLCEPKSPYAMADAHIRFEAVWGAPPFPFVTVAVTPPE